MSNGTRLREWARAIKRDVVALYIAGRDPRVPWPMKAMAVAIAAYALSPIDLVPDFIRVLGYLDELILLPIAIALVIRMIPRSAHGGVPRGGAAAIRAPDQPCGRGGDHQPLDCRGSVPPVGVLAHTGSIGHNAHFVDIFPRCARLL
jgi:uncharacterized membrane protein YkvA (DUF1232 family)